MMKALALQLAENIAISLVDSGFGEETAQT